MAQAQALEQALRLMLRPLVRFCLKRSLPIRQVTATLKELYLDLAVEEIESTGEKITVSRLSALTGIHRKDVDRIYVREEKSEFTPDIPSRVILQWRRDRRFLTASGKPRVLEYVGEESDFWKLARAVSLEYGPPAILFQLERIGAVERTVNGVKLKAVGHEARRGSLDGYRFLGEDMEDLALAVMENIDCKESTPPNIHYKIKFDNIPPSEIPRIRRWFDQRCHLWFKQVERYLAAFDLDTSSGKGKNKELEGGSRVVFGLFTRT